jgi:hypothetical protein
MVGGGRANRRNEQNEKKTYLRRHFLVPWPSEEEEAVDGRVSLDVDAVVVVGETRAGSCTKAAAEPIARGASRTRLETSWERGDFRMGDELRLAAP